MTRSIVKIPNDLIGVAGVHFIVSKLTLRGLIALPTIRNTAGIDILVSGPDGSAQANLQVKTSLKKVNFWPTSAPERCLNSPNSYCVFLRYLPERESFEVFLENSKNVTRQVNKNLEDYRTRGRKEFTYWSLPSNQKELQRLRRNWETWRPLKPRKGK